MTSSAAGLLEPVAAIARAAGGRILEVYNRPGDIAAKGKQDDSPLTEADIAAHHAIVDGLAALTPDVPVVSEESYSPDDAARLGYVRFWLVDPLDGTKEFLKRNGEFTVNIALIERGEPVLGVVHVPVLGVTYGGVRGSGAYREDGDGRRAIRARRVDEATRDGGRLVVVASRSHGGDTLVPLLAAVEHEFGPVDMANMGSSLKICLVAEGKADLYPRLAPTSEWDTAAAQAVLEAAGGHLLDPALKPLRYNRGTSILNPHFVCLGDDPARWSFLGGLV